MMTTYTGQAETADERFVALLRTALRRLYDNSALRSSPLVAAFGLADEPDPPAALRQLLTDAIRALQPRSGTPADTQMWRVYEVLLYRYVQRSTQIEVADQLGLSVRHLSRLERDALEVLRRQLPDCRGDYEPVSLGEELAWLVGTDWHETVDLGIALGAVMELAQPLAEQHGVRLLLANEQDTPTALQVHQVALRQILLSLISSAIRCARGGEVQVNVSMGEAVTCVSVRCSNGDTEARAHDSPDISTPDMKVIQGLTEACGGELDVSLEQGSFGCKVCLPAIRQLPVLVVDDNPTTLQLLRRYVTGTRYRVVGAQSLEEGLVLVHDLAPELIVLDVMMPDMDGWEALGRLRQHPHTSHIPVVICTILPEEELALSLGASGFVRKPVTREAFLRALDQTGLAGSASA